LGLWNKLVLAGAITYFNRKKYVESLIPYANLRSDRISKVLLVSNTAIGDTLMSTPAIRAVKKTFSHIQVGLVYHVRNELLIRHNPYIDISHEYKSKFYGMRSLIEEIREQNYDLAAILHGNDPESLPMLYLAGIRTIIGTAESKFKFLTSDPLPTDNPYQHTIEKRLNFVRHFGAQSDGYYMDFFIPTEQMAVSQRIIEERFGSSAGPIVAFHPAGSAPYKWWPAERFVEIADRLWRSYKARIMVVCGSKESELGEAIVEKTAAPAFSTSGRYNLMEVGGLLSKCALMITTDSGPMHMAFALKVPTLALSADHPSRIGPYGIDDAVMLYHKDGVCLEPVCLKKRCPANRCMQAISTDHVFTVITGQFGKYLG